jgi:PP-loop superfamily ATP-utilizing enzyme
MYARARGRGIQEKRLKCLICLSSFHRRINPNSGTDTGGSNRVVDGTEGRDLTGDVPGRPFRKFATRARGASFR